MRTGIGPVIKNHVTFQVHWIVSAVCHRVCCLTSSVPPGKQDQDQPTFLVRAKAACLSWPQYMLPPGLREWILQFQYFLMLIRKLQNSWVHCHESDFDCQWHGARGTQRRRHVTWQQVHKRLHQCKGKVSCLYRGDGAPGVVQQWIQEQRWSKS